MHGFTHTQGGATRQDPPSPKILPLRPPQLPTFPTIRTDSQGAAPTSTEVQEVPAERAQARYAQPGCVLTHSGAEGPGPPPSPDPGICLLTAPACGEPQRTGNRTLRGRRSDQGKGPPHEGSCCCCRGGGGGGSRKAGSRALRTPL